MSTAKQLIESEVRTGSRKSPKRLAEGRGDSYDIKLSSLPKDWERCEMELLDANAQVVMTAQSSDFPLPWDGAIKVKGSNIVIEGNAGPSGYGYAMVEVPKGRADRDMELNVSMFEDNPEEIEDIFRRYRIVLVRGSY